MKTLSLLAKGAFALMPLGFLVAGGCSGGSGTGFTSPTAVPTAIPTAVPTATPTQEGTPTSTPLGTPTPTPVATATPTATPFGPHTPKLEFGNRVALGAEEALEMFLTPGRSSSTQGLNVSFHGTRAVGQSQNALAPFITLDSSVAGVTYFEKNKLWQAAGGMVQVTEYNSGIVAAGSPGKLSFQFINVRMIPVAGTGATGEFTLNRTYAAISGTV